MHIITTLFENISYKRGLTSGHGLSYYLETPHGRVLFDTGPSDAIVQNAAVLGIDLSSVDALVISHGHFDHTGGLPAFTQLNDKAKIYMKPSAIAEKFKGYHDYIGIPLEWEDFRHRVSWAMDTTEILPGVFLMPVTGIHDPEDTHFVNFFVRENSKFRPDEFLDEQFLVVKGKERVHVISGCSHRGITNVIREVKETFDMPLGVVTGGFHLMSSGEEFVVRVAHDLEQLGVQQVEVSHCTGIDQYHFLRSAFPGKVFYNHTGKTLVLEP